MNVAAERAYPTPLSSSSLLPLLLLSLARQRHTPETSTKIRREYDYVIVGGGTAGAVVASRLSELPCVNVLLLEAGHEPPKLTEVPALSGSFWFTDVDWQFRTVPQKHTGSSLVNRQVVYPSGKMLGGSSSLNGMIYVRGNRRNYDEWAEMGAKGWSYKDVYPYFLKMEDNKDREFLANGYHTTGGPLTVQQPEYDPELKQAVAQSALNLGYKIVDSNANRQTGFSDFQSTIRNNQRCSTAKAYLVPAENRTNLDIVINAMVTKIIINKYQARGVRFDFDGHTYEVSARKEVIVSAGTINSPKLLMLSGVGPRHDLQKLNIPVIADLPVGRNFHDHGGTQIPFVLNHYIPDFGEKITDPDSINEYIRNRTGPLASAYGVNFLAFLKGQAIYSPVDFPNYELFFAEATTTDVRKYAGLKYEVYRKLYGPYEEKPLFICYVSQLQPRSRGKVTLKSKDPYAAPVIDPNYLADERDIDDLVQGMKTCQRIGTSKALRKLGSRPFKTLIPGCEKYANDEDEYFTCQVKSIFISFHHAVGTAKMGDPMDPTTVVDPKLRVKNIKGLRVVDASVMPKITSGNINIPTIMIAEKASEIIKGNIHCYRKHADHWDLPEDSSDWSKEDSSEEEEENWDRPKENPWIEDYEDSSKEEWQDPKEYSWLGKEKKSLNSYLQKHEKYPCSKEDNSGEDYLDIPKKSSWQESEEEDEHYVDPATKSWPSSDKYHSRDQVKNPNDFHVTKNHRLYSEDYWKNSPPISWYKKQTDLILNEINKPKKISWYDDMNLGQYWGEPSKYKMTKSLDELIKLADGVPDQMAHGYKWDKSDSNSKASWY